MPLPRPTPPTRWSSKGGPTHDCRSEANPNARIGALHRFDRGLDVPRRRRVRAALSGGPRSGKLSHPHTAEGVHLGAAFLTGSDPIARHGGRVLVDQLRRHRVDTIFTVPGEAFLPVLDALYDQPLIRTVTCRHEAGATIMAEAHARLRGEPGVALVARGPGATHASVGVHNAAESSTPLLLFVGQVPTGQRGRGAFQEVDIEALFAPLAKWAVEVEHPEHLSQVTARAVRVAREGRPGPVVVSVPEDVLAGQVSAPDAPAAAPPSRPAPGPEELTELRSLLERSHRPLVMVGGGTWNADAARALTSWAERNHLPVAVSFRRQDFLDNRSPCYIGHSGVGIVDSLAARILQADLIIAIGTRLSDTATKGYTLLEPPNPKQTLVHIHVDPKELGRVYQPTLGICAGTPETLAAIAATPPLSDRPWRDWAAAARSDYEATLLPPPAPGAVNFGEVMTYLDSRLPPEAILTNGAGNYTLWPQRYYRFKQYGTQLGPQSGAMGYAVPAAVAAKLHHPDVPVVAISGDGDFLMTGQELATAVQYDAPIIVLVVNNGMLATIRMHQERTFPGRPSSTDLDNPDFAAYARAFGAFGATIERTRDFPPAFEQAVDSRVPAVLNILVDPEAILPHATLSEVRRQAQTG
ncbi:MAG: thiamine pyrophosphate-binding protein [Acidimicrobiia bacterium]|nr:thiamine pyrophosphate-binding protein [Acidimicrobiia bacterium]